MNRCHHPTHPLTIMASPLIHLGHSALYEVCYEHGIPFTKALVTEYDEWIQTHVCTDEMGCDHVHEFITPKIPPKVLIPVYVKTLAGELISLNYRGKIQDLVLQLREDNPEDYPLGRVQVVPLDPQQTVVVPESVFGVIVHPPPTMIQHVTTSIWCDTNDIPWRMYHFHINGAAAFLPSPYMADPAVYLARHGPIDLHITYRCDTGAFQLQNYTQHNYWNHNGPHAVHLYPYSPNTATIQGLAAGIRFYNTPAIGLAPAYQLRPEAQKELISIYECITMK